MLVPLGYIAIAGIIGCLVVNGQPKKVFISYYSKGNSNYKNMIMAWVKNSNLELDFEDVSTDVKIKSTDVSYMKRKMRERICKADYFIVFIGKDTHKREWVLWEIEQALILQKPIIAIKEKRGYKSPKPLLGSGTKWVFGFSEKGIRTALESV